MNYDFLIDGETKGIKYVSNTIDVIHPSRTGARSDWGVLPRLPPCASAYTRETKSSITRHLC